MNLRKCTQKEYSDFIAINFDRLKSSEVRICFPPMLVWYDTQGERGSIETVVATQTMNESVGIAEENEYQIPEGGVIELPEEKP